MNKERSNSATLTIHEIHSSNTMSKPTPEFTEDVREDTRARPAVIGLWYHEISFAPGLKLKPR